jgi:hypothetical protein
MGCFMADSKEALGALLDSLGESVQFATAGAVAPVLPGLYVKGVGSIGAPVTEADAKRLIAKATQAPYGRGEETIVDTDVRRVWQIEPAQFSLRNAAWNAHLEEIVAAVKQDFGIHRKVTPHLYKLLIYEKGSFFAPHRDSEKTPGMFATLVVCLPSKHKGGTLIVKHDGQTKKIGFGGKDAEFKTQYAAFYADCQHEIKPVTAGYRVCIVYNLAIAGKKQPAAPGHSTAVEEAAQLLKELFADPSLELSKIAIPLTHQYTEAGLDPRQLKGDDRATADVLVRAAESLDYQCNFALLTHYQSGAPDYDTLDYGPSWGRRWSRYDDFDEDEDEEDDDSGGGFDSGADMVEVYDEKLTLDHWLDPQGRKQPFGEIHLAKDEVLGLDDDDEGVGWPYREEIHEATGNEGVSMERWYRQAVLVIWPRDHHFGILAGEGQASALPDLERMAARSKKPEALAACRTFAAEIIDHWQPQEDPTAGEGSYSGRLLKLLPRIGTEDLARDFLGKVLPKDFDGTEGKALLAVCQHFGWSPFKAELPALIAQQKPDNDFTELKQIVALCEPLCCDPPALSAERRAVCAEIAAALVQVIERWDKKRADTWSWYGPGETRAGIVAGAVRIFSAIPRSEHLNWFLDHVLADPKHYDLREVLIPDVKALHERLPKDAAGAAAAARLLEHCRAELRAATAHPIEPPADWAREAKLGCNCEDCKALSKFLRDPDQRVGRFPIKKERRRHLHQQIDRHQCDCTHVTERKGSPQTLVCTKTQGSYERRLKQYGEDQKRLAELDAIAGGKKSKAARRTTSRRKAKT